MEEINNFRLVGTYTTEPPYLVFLENFKGFEIHYSTFNPLLRVIKTDDDEFFSYENNGDSTDLTNDIRGVIMLTWKMPADEEE